MKNGLIVDEYGIKRWYLDDKLHREDGPAVEYSWGSKERNTYKAWFRNGEFIKRYPKDQDQFKLNWKKEGF